MFGNRYSANAYIPQAGPNLEIALETRVAKLNLEADESGLLRASGVTLTDGVVITASSEGLLELSGIGKASVLEAAGIDQLVDLSGVGENLQDHIDFFLSYQLQPESRPGFDTLAISPTYADEQMALWHGGSLSQYDQSDKVYVFTNWTPVVDNSTNLIEPAKDALSQLDGNLTEVDMVKLGYLTDPSVPQFEAELIDGYIGHKGYPSVDSLLYGAIFFTIFVEVMHPLSRGTVHITSANISDPPIIDGNWLSNEYDIQIAIASLKFARKIANTEPLASIWLTEYEPGGNVTTDEQWRQFVVDTAESTDHPISTCAMLPRDGGGMVDPKLLVYRTSNVRVVDASIIPLQPSAHIQTAVYGIAEMAADFIVDEWLEMFA